VSAAHAGSSQRPCRHAVSKQQWHPYAKNQWHPYAKKHWHLLCSVYVGLLAELCVCVHAVAVMLLQAHWSRRRAHHHYCHARFRGRAQRTHTAQRVSRQQQAGWLVDQPGRLLEAGWWQLAVWLAGWSNRRWNCC
jgi:hypothetical protein